MSPIGSVGRSVRGRRLPDAIPDSAIHQYSMEITDGDTLIDLIGDADLTEAESGPQQVSNNFKGGVAVDFSGGGGYDRPVPSGLEQDGQYTFACTIEVFGINNSTFDTVWMAQTDGEERTGSKLSSGGSDDFTVNMRPRNERDDIVGFEASFDTKYRMHYLVDGQNTSNSEIYGNLTKGTNPDSDNLNDETDETFQLGIEINPNETPAHINGIIDHVVVYDELLDSNGREMDYDAQPWT